VKIAFRHHKSGFIAALARALAQGLPGHEFLDWPADGPAPSEDLELLLVVGQLGRAEIEHQAKLCFIQTTSAGHEGIDVEAASELGIWVSFAPSGETGNAISVAEWAIMLMIGASRDLKAALAAVADPARPMSRVNAALHGKSACIVGLGAIGRAIAERLVPFGMTLTGTDQKPEIAPGYVRAYPSGALAEAVAAADYVIVCAPAGKANDHLIDANVLAKMKPGAVLVNISRGSLVDEAALAAALSDGHISAVGLDVVEREPVDPGNPLLAFPQALITPHMAGGTDLMLAGTVEYIAGIVRDVEAGKKPASVFNAPGRPRRALR
jgi:phosphoglycerate dehydrogenase-like enzyme